MLAVRHSPSARTGKEVQRAEAAHPPWMGVTDWRITGIPPLARIARYARDAQRRYLPTPTADDPVIDELGSPETGVGGLRQIRWGTG